jgi:hypothetical protein
MKNQQHADCNSLVMRYEAKKVKTRFNFMKEKNIESKKSWNINEFYPCVKDAVN